MTLTLPFKGFLMLFEKVSDQKYNENSNAVKYYYNIISK